MIIFTIKGDVLGDPNFGASLEELLNTTLLSGIAVEESIKSQIDTYIPELEGRKYKLRVEFIEDPTDFRELMVVYFELADYEVLSIFGERSMQD